MMKLAWSEYGMTKDLNMGDGEYRSEEDYAELSALCDELIGVLQHVSNKIPAGVDADLEDLGAYVYQAIAKADQWRKP